MNCTPIVRQYDILNNDWGAVHFLKMGPARFLFPEWYNLPLLLLQSFAKKYTTNCKIIGKTVERRRCNAKWPIPLGWQPAVERQSPAHGRALYAYEVN